MRRFRRPDDDADASVSETLSDLSLSALGMIMIAFIGYLLKFRSEEVAAIPAPHPPGAMVPAEQVAGLTDQLRQAATEKQRLEQALQQLEATLAEPSLFGLKGPLTETVILLDLSGSMVGYDGTENSWPKPELMRRFDEVKQRVARLVRSLRFRSFKVIGFGGEREDNGAARLMATSPTLVEATERTRDEATQAILGWEAIGGTPTLPALREAFGDPELAHVILLTDGLPTVGGTQSEVLEFLRSQRTRGVIVDVIGVGDQTTAPADEADMALLEFTRQIAAENGGFFQAW